MKLFDLAALFGGKPKVDYLPDATGTMAVAGTSFRQGVISAPGLYHFRFVADPKNKHDKNAVMVYQGKNHVGFVPSSDALSWSRLVLRRAEAGTGTWVQGEVRQDGDGRWILLTVPPLKKIREWLKA